MRCSNQLKPPWSVLSSILHPHFQVRPRLCNSCLRTFGQRYPPFINETPRGVQFFKFSVSQISVCNKITLVGTGGAVSKT